MATILVSFIGTGSRSGGEYEATKYFFDGEVNFRETSIFGSELLQYLKDNNRNVEKWLILGTDKSIWSELIKMFPSLFSDDKRKLKDSNYESQREFLEEQTIYCQSDKDYQSKIKQENLDKWQEILTNNLINTNVICRLVGDATDSTSQNAIFQSLLDVVKENNKVVFDVTHGLRNQPIITSFVLMYLRYLRNIKAENIEFYYGAKDLDGKVIKLDFCNQLLEATEAVAIYEQTGNYVRIGEQLDLGENFNEKLSALNFADEMHRATPDLPLELKKQLENNIQQNPRPKSLSEKLNQALDWSTNQSYPKRLKDKAIFYKNRKQYFKAIASLYEAIAVASCLIVKQRDNGKKLDINDYWDRNYAVNNTAGIKDWLDSTQESKLENLQKLRNTVLHGTEKTNLQILNAIKDEQLFLNIFESGIEVLEDILNGKIKNS